MVVVVEQNPTDSNSEKSTSREHPQVPTTPSTSTQQSGTPQDPKQSSQVSARSSCRPAVQRFVMTHVYGSFGMVYIKVKVQAAPMTETYTS